MTDAVRARTPVLALLVQQLWAAVLLWAAFGAQAGVVFTTVHSFQFFPNGAYPYGALVQGSDGYFYGTTSYCGTNGAGTVFKINTNGVLTTLYAFTGSNDGGGPDAGLVEGSDGYFYGTTAYGGTNNWGTVFRISANGVLTTLYSFSGGNDGGDPEAGLVEGSDGSLYGTTHAGGTNDAGTVFRISTAGVLAGLYSFTGGDDGASPYAGLMSGGDGSFYGTTANGGTNNSGTVFKINTNGALTSLYSFTGGDDGANPYASLVLGSDGNFYGTAEDGGRAAWGTVFKISPSGALTNLYSFSGGADGGNPNGLVQGSDGSFYGTTYGSSGGPNWGTVFKISTNGTLTTLYSFTGGSDGANPSAGVVLGGDGYFYGTTYSGGADGGGTLFQISSSGALTSLYSFTGINDDGAYPAAALVQGSDGYFYGTTEDGGAYGLGYDGHGTVFKISPGGALTSLYSFTGGNDGENPRASLVQGSDGRFYGTTSGGGTNGWGTVFKITTAGALISLYSFTGGNDGGDPEAGLVQGSDGYFYGTTEAGGAYGVGGNGYGTVFKISSTGVLSNLYSFTAGDDGAYPYAGLVQGSDGNFYGTTSSSGMSNVGTVFKISPTGALTTLYSFTGGADGASPYAPLVQGSDGNFYGTTAYGGTSDLGAVFEISPSGALTSLYSFTGGDDGESPNGLVEGSDGNLYGTTFGIYYGPDWGTVFKISTNGVLTTLHTFGFGTEGANPYAGLVQASDGTFWGTTVAGGAGGVGNVFRLSLGPIQPELTIIPYGAYVILTWPTDATGFTLEFATNLVSGAAWNPVSPGPVVIGDQFVVFDAAAGAQKLYRLRSSQ